MTNQSCCFSSGYRVLRFGRDDVLGAYELMQASTRRKADDASDLSKDAQVPPRRGMKPPGA